MIEKVFIGTHSKELDEPFMGFKFYITGNFSPWPKSLIGEENDSNGLQERVQVAI